MKALISTTLVLVLAAGAFADEILMNGGGAIEGEIHQVVQSGIIVKSGDKTIEVAPGDLDPLFYYTQWSKRIDKDGEQHLRLAV